jgi:hypothetical protein
MPVVGEFESLSEKLARVTAECERLRAENERLRSTLTDHALRSEEKQSVPTPTGEAPLATACHTRTELSVSEKIALFRSLFRGREDVYAIQWDRPNENVSYSPACLRDWKALRSVPEVERRKMDKATRQLLPLTDEARSISIFPENARSASIHCYKTRLAGFSLSISIRSRGSLTRLHFWNRAANGMSPPYWSVPAPGTEHTSGCSSGPRFRQVWPANSERAC